MRHGYLQKRLLLAICLSTLLTISLKAQIDSVLLQAIKSCDTSTISKRLDDGVSLHEVDAHGATPLMWAVYYCSLPTVQYLVHHGARFGPSDTGFLQISNEMYGSVHAIAAAKGKMKIFEYCIDSLKLDINEINIHPTSKQRDGMTPLSIAVMAGEYDIVSYILQHGGNPELLDRFGTSTPLCLAARYEQWKIFDLLLNEEIKTGKHGKVPEEIIITEKKLKKLYPISLNTNNLPQLESFVVQIKKWIFGELHVGYASSLLDLALDYSDISQYSQADSFFLKSKAIFQKIGKQHHPNYPITLNSLGYCYYKMGEYAKAIPELEEAILVTKKYLGPESENVAGSLILLGLVSAELAKYDKAKTYYEEALTLVKKINGSDHPLYAIILNNYAFLYYNLGQYNDAIPLYIQAREIMKKKYSENEYHREGTLIDIANAYFKLGDYKEALPLFEKGIKFTKKTLGENNENYARMLNGLAMLYVSLGKYDAALPLFKDAMRIVQKVLGNKHAYYSLIINNLASLYEITGMYNKAQDLLEQALVITEKNFGKNHPEYAKNLNDLANLFVNKGEYVKALSLFKQSLQITKQAVGQNYPLSATNLNNQANVYFYLKNYDSARFMYQQSLDIGKRIFGPAHPYNVASLNGLGLLHSINGDQEEASSLLIEANRIELNHLFRTYTTLSEQEKMILLNKELFQFSYLPSLLCKGYKESTILPQVYTNELILKGMVLEDKKQLLNIIRKNSDSITIALYQDWQFNNNVIGKQELLPIAQRSKNLDSIKIVKNELEQQLSRHAASFYQNISSERLTSKDISKKLKPGEAAIEFIKFKKYNENLTDSTIYAAIVLLPGDTIGKFVHLFEERKLARLLRPYAGSTTSFAAIKRLYGTGSVRDSLYKIIWAPLERFIQGVKTIYYAPTGLLHRVAFQAISNDSGHLLIDKYHLNQLLSTRSVAQPATINTKPTSVGIWGNIEYNWVDMKVPIPPKKSYIVKNVDSPGSLVNVYAMVNRDAPGKEWKPLSGSRLEILQIKNIFDKIGIHSRIDSGDNALEESFKNLDGSSPNVIHMATHGFFLPIKHSKQKSINDLGSTGNAFSLQQNPMFRSGLVLAGGNEAWKGKEIKKDREDGILTAYEIAQMDLSNTELVVLSACETGLGDLEGNEGVIGLQRAFKMAGAKQMIMSLWKVPDHETMELMTLFYTNWLKGETPRNALRLAQLNMRAKYPPYFWAAFVLVE